MRGIPRIAGRRGIAESERRGGYLAEDDRAGRTEAGYRDGIRGRLAMRPGPGAGGSDEPRRIVNVLEGHGHAVERAHEAPLARLHVPLNGDASRRVPVEMHPRLERRLHRVDALEAGGEEVGGRQRARADAAGRFRGGDVVEIRHGRSPEGYWRASSTSATTSKRPKDGMR